MPPLAAELIARPDTLGRVFPHVSINGVQAYVPKEKRVLGYFALPVLIGNEIVAAIDLKADRTKKKLLIQQWTWTGKKRAQSYKARIEIALHPFEHFEFPR